jgi:hypothetical protein
VIADIVEQESERKGEVGELPYRNVSQSMGPDIPSGWYSWNGPRVHRGELRPEGVHIADLFSKKVSSLRRETSSMERRVRCSSAEGVRPGSRRSRARARAATRAEASSSSSGAAPRYRARTMAASATARKRDAECERFDHQGSGRGFFPPRKPRAMGYRFSGSMYALVSASHEKSRMGEGGGRSSSSQRKYQTVPAWDSPSIAPVSTAASARSGPGKRNSPKILARAARSAVESTQRMGAERSPQ